MAVYVMNVFFSHLLMNNFTISSVDVYRELLKLLKDLTYFMFIFKKIILIIVSHFLPLDKIGSPALFFGINLLFKVFDKFNNNFCNFIDKSCFILFQYLPIDSLIIMILIITQSDMLFFGVLGCDIQILNKDFGLLYFYLQLLLFGEYFLSIKKFACGQKMFYLLDVFVFTVLN